LGAAALDSVLDIGGWAHYGRNTVAAYSAALQGASR